MTTTQYTPGPWTQKEARTMTHLHGANGAMIGSLPIGRTMQEPAAKRFEREANARLIAAAPELLETLAAIVAAADAHPFCTLGYVIEHGAGRNARAAIAKARGEIVPAVAA